MLQVNSPEFNKIKNQNIENRKLKEQKHQNKLVKKAIDHEFIVLKNNNLRSINKLLRDTKLIKRELKINLKNQIKLVNLNYNFDLLSGDDEEALKSKKTELLKIYNNMISLYTERYNLFEEAYFLNKIYLLSNKKFSIKAKIDVLTPIEDKLSVSEKQSLAALHIESKETDKSIEEAIRLHKKNYRDIHNKKIASIKDEIEKINSLKASKSKLTVKEKKSIISLKDEKAQLKYAKNLEFYRAKIEKIQKKAEAKINLIKYNEKIAKYTNDKATELIDAVALNSTQLQKKWNVLIENAIPQTFENVRKRKIQEQKIRWENELKDFKATKSLLPPISVKQKIKLAFTDFFARHAFGNSLNEYRKRFAKNTRKNSMLYILIFIMIIFSILTNGDILTTSNIISTIENNIYVFIIGMGLLLVIIGGYIDLSVGSLYGFVAFMSAKMYSEWFNFQVLPTLVGALLLGLFVGLLNGILVGYAKIPSFVATLATMLISRGGMLAASNNGASISVASGNYNEVVAGKMPDYAIGSFHIVIFGIFIVASLLIFIMLLKSRTQAEKYGLPKDKLYLFILKTVISVGFTVLIGILMAFSPKGTPYYIIYAVIIILIMLFVTKNTSFGRRVYAIGGNKNAAELSGINSKSTTLIIFVVTGILAGLTGFLITGILETAVSNGGEGKELDVISSVYVGGASAYGGIGSVSGTVFGAFILSFITNGMNLLYINVAGQYIIKGLILVLAVGYDVYSNRKIG